MSTADVYKLTLFNDGEEITFGDMNNLQKTTWARTLEQLLSAVAPNVNYGAPSYDPEFTGQLGTDMLTTPYAYTLSSGSAYPRQGTTNAKVQIAPGTLLQKISATDGSGDNLLAFTFVGTEEVTIANGDVTNPRVDIVQMKLEWSTDGNAASRVFAQAPVKAHLNLALHTVNDDTVVRAKVPGFGGDHITIAMSKRPSGSGVTYSESGNLITIIYKDGVSTVGDVETAITASSTLIEISTSGTLATVLHDPGDSFTATPLIAGSDQLLVTQSMNKSRRVKCTLLVKQGTPAASPLYPDLDAGYVAIAGVVVGTNYVAAAGIKFEDTAGAVAVLHDQRMPFCIRAHHTTPRSFIFAAGSTETNRTYTQSDGSANNLWIPLMEGGQCGRLVMVAASMFDAAALDSRISRIKYFDGGGFIASTVLDLAHANMNGGTSVFKRRAGGSLFFQGAGMFAAGPTVLQNATSKIGAPIWTNGKRAPTETFKNDTTPNMDILVITFVASANTSQFGPATFYVANGL